MTISALTSDNSSSVGSETIWSADEAGKKVENRKKILQWAAANTGDHNRERNQYYYFFIITAHSRYITYSDVADSDLKWCQRYTIHDQVSLFHAPNGFAY